jgi:hypothetical protein
MECPYRQDWDNGAFLSAFSVRPCVDLSLFSELMWSFPEKACP